jgi:hypothetical protein
VGIDLEPLSLMSGGTPYPRPIDAQTARTRALEEASLFFSAMVYGWAFHYEVGEKARGIAEDIELTNQGAVRFRDPGFSATDAELRDGQLRMWADYRLTEVQKRRAGSWRSGLTRNVQGLGYNPLNASGKRVGEAAAEGNIDWIGVKQATLEDAARSGVRAMLRGSERNRPREVSGYIALAEFPRFFMSHGQWAVSARFRVEVREIVPFAVY